MNGFGIATRLLNLAAEDALLETIDMKSASLLLKRLVQNRIRQNKIPPKAEHILNYLVRHGRKNPNQLAKELKMFRPNVSRELSRLKSARLVESEQIGRQNIYFLTPDVKIALEL